MISIHGVELLEQLLNSVQITKAHCNASILYSFVQVSKTIRAMAGQPRHSTLQGLLGFPCTLLGILRTLTKVLLISLVLFS